MRLLIRLLAFGSALALVAGCGAVSSDAAAEVNDVDVARSLLESVVAASQEQTLAAAAQNLGVSGEDELTTEQRAAVLAEHQRAMLSLLIQDAIITSMVADAGVEIDEADTAAIRADIVEAVQGEDSLEELLVQDGLSMEIFDEVLLPQQARVVALREELAEGETLETRTVRHILVETEAEAEAVVAELEAGADFAELAQERSIDTGSGAQGGLLGSAPRGAYVGPFEEAAWGAEIGELVGPVETQFGFHILEVVEEDVTPADELPPQQLDQLVNPALNALVEAAYADAEIEVDPAFGRWEEQTRSVVPVDDVGGSPELPDDLGGLEPDEPDEP